MTMTQAVVQLVRAGLGMVCCAGFLLIPVGWLLVAGRLATGVNRAGFETTSAALAAWQPYVLRRVRFRVSTFGALSWGHADLYLTRIGVFVAMGQRPFVQYVRAGVAAPRLDGVWAVRPVYAVQDRGGDLVLLCGRGVFPLKVVLRDVDPESRARLRAILAGY